MRTKACVFVTAVALSLSAQSTGTPAQVDLKALADSVSPTGTTLERTRTLVHWVNDNFTWSYTDYVKRTPQEIVARRAGNCAELASVMRRRDGRGPSAPLKSEP